MNSREAFERVFSNSCVDLSKDETGEYSSQPTRMCYSFFVVGWQEQQKRIDELCVGIRKLIEEYKSEEKELELKEWEQSTIYGRIAIELEQALKGGEDQYQETRKHVDNRIKNGAKLTNHRIEL